MDYQAEYRKKLVTPEEAVRAVKSGDWVDYGHGAVRPWLLDEALAARRDELTDVKIRGQQLDKPLHVIECDPDQTHFMYNGWHYSTYERHFADEGRVMYEPMLYSNIARYYEQDIQNDVVMICVPPMDEHGYFTLSTASGVMGGIVRTAKTLILEVNENLPVVGSTEAPVHISDVTYVVEGKHGPLPEMRGKVPTEKDNRIAAAILPFIRNGATIQLGVGGLPTALGKMIADSDLKDLGMHTEFLSEAYYHMYRAGKLTNRRKAVLPGLGVFSVSITTAEVYAWMNRNPSILSVPLSFVNDPAVIRQMENFVSINGCVAVDLYGQVTSETAGLRQISGSGGQMNFVEGAYLAPGGRSFLALNASRTDKNGVKHSNIVPHFNGEVITTPRSVTQHIVTEHGAVNLAGQPGWERAERLISIADPDFREELIRAAEAQGIWRRSNKR